MCKNQCSKECCLVLLKGVQDGRFWSRLEGWDCGMKGMINHGTGRGERMKKARGKMLQKLSFNVVRSVKLSCHSNFLLSCCYPRTTPKHLAISGQMPPSSPCLKKQDAHAFSMPAPPLSFSVAIRGRFMSLIPSAATFADELVTSPNAGLPPPPPPLLSAGRFI